MLLFGFSWAVVITIPFAILSSCIPKHRVGWFMGLFNVFVVIPEILVSLFTGFIVKHAFGNNILPMFIVGGISMIIASIFAYKVREVASEPVMPAEAGIQDY